MFPEKKKNYTIKTLNYKIIIEYEYNTEKQ